MSFMSDDLKNLFVDGALFQVIIVDSEGMVVEAAGEEYNPEELSALFFPFQGFASDIKESLNVEKVEELLLTTDGKPLKVVLKSFMANKMQFFLIAISATNIEHQKLTNTIIKIFYKNFEDLTGEEITQSSLLEEHPAEEIDAEAQAILEQAEAEEAVEVATATPVESFALIDEIKGITQKITQEIQQTALEEGKKPEAESTEVAIDMISYKLVKKLSSNIVEKMVQKTLLRMIENLIKRESSQLKKEIESMFS